MLCYRTCVELSGGFIKSGLKTAFSFTYVFLVASLTRDFLNDVILTGLVFCLYQRWKMQFFLFDKVQVHCYLSNEKQNRVFCRRSIQPRSRAFKWHSKNTCLEFQITVCCYLHSNKLSEAPRVQLSARLNKTLA